MLDTVTAPTPTIDSSSRPARVGSVSTRLATRPTFPADDGFYAEVRRRVKGYFQQTGKSERDCFSMYLKTFIILAWMYASWALLVFSVDTLWLAIPLVISFSLAMSAIGFSIQHDGGHNAYSNRPWINRTAACALDLMGASSYLWKWKHNIIHHTYTNVSGIDTDIEIGSIVRVSPHQKRRWFHRWQHFYLFALYGITASRWHLYGDYKEVITGYMGPHKIPRPRGKDLAIFMAGKISSILVMLVIPMLIHPWWVVLLFYMIATAVMGIAMSIVFQLAHCVEEAEFPMPNPETSRLDQSWAIHQAETTVDFARGNWPLSWWLGGLNFQIEHHLFPQVCHVHYPAISKIVEETCNEYGVQYRAHRTFRAGLLSHYRWLREMGRPVKQSAEALAVTN
jgi:linoleoyl-CoA desaturase